MDEERVLRVYRVVLSNPPTPWDMTGLLGRGRKVRHPTPENLRRAEGVSVFDTIEKARQYALMYWPKLGTMIAILDVPEDSFEVSEPDEEGHRTVWGEPEALLATVCVVVPISLS